jgi:hypothetical protein
VYEIVRVYPNKAEEILQTVESRDDVPLHVETPQFVGTWINENRKLLRYGRGEIRIRRVINRPSIGGKATTTVSGRPAYMLSIKYADELDWILISADYIAGLNLLRKELWRVNSFVKLPTLIDKELAYQCMLEYDMLIDEFNLVGML